MATFFIQMRVGDNVSGRLTYVATEDDVEMGGWTDIIAENFAFASKEEAEAVKKRLEGFVQDKGYLNTFLSVIESR